MKTNILLLFCMATLAVTFTSCKKGCTTAWAVNYDDAAKKDDASCTMPSEFFAGTWNAHEYEVNTGNTDDFQYEFTFTNDTSFEFHDLRTVKPVYDINGFNGSFNYQQMHIHGDGYIDGEIINDDSLIVTYYYGTPGGSYTVTLTLTR
jgi:hypothetical protein